MGLNNHLITLLVLSLLLTACQQETQTNEDTAVNYANIEVSYPATEKQDVVDNYHGTDVTDAYRWLEDDRSEETGAWVSAQNEATFGYLEQIPFREQMERRLTELVNYARTSSPFRVGDYYFFSKNDGLQNQSVIYIQDGLEGEPRVFIDPNQLNEDGTTSIGLMGADKTNKYMAYSRSDAGSDWRKMYVRDIETNTDLEDELEWVKFSGAAWFGDGFFYSRYPAPAEGDELKGDNTMHSVYYHKLGTPQSADKLIFSDEENPAYYHFGYTTEEEDFFILNQQPGTDGFAVYVLDLRKSNSLDNPNFELLFDGFSNKNYVVHNEGEDFWVQTDYEAPNYRLVKMKLTEPAPENWMDVLPESDNLLQSVSTGGGYFFAQYLEKATDHVYRMKYDGSDRQEVTLPGLGNVGGFGGKAEEEQLFYTFRSFTYPPTVFSYNVATGESTPFFEPELPFDPTDFEEKQVTYTSKDGTPVTMFIVHKKGMELDGDNPTYLYGYGGFNISLTPSFSAFRFAMLENGGVFAMPNLRGGGEYGEEWHQAGMLMNKQNVFDDFIAAAEYLIDEGYTRSEKLAIAGGSNGGLLVGAAMTQRPDLFAVAFPAVGVMDMLRYHRFTVGKGWIPEYGCADSTQAEFENLVAYSPLHNLEDGTAYPATMVTTADHDDRVVPAHSFKFAARLQEAHEGENPVLIRIETDAGHGAGKPISKSIEEQADLWSFFFYNTDSKVNF
ncbi:MAG: prolyl oligopeptidase family serine peptidase [Bacteroidota bacterium]